MRELEIRWLGRVPYADALELQQKRVEAVRTGAAADVLLLLEHPPVITLGRGAKASNIRVSRDRLRARGIEVHRVSRGGDVTFHGPQQLVGYLILDLAARGRPDVHRFLRDLEGAIVECLAGLGLAAGTRPGMTGVFVEPSDPPRKIASIGVGVRGWVTFHGFALNVGADLDDFELVVPCGLRQVEMTSIERELGAPLAIDADLRARIAEVFGRRFA